jgi:adenine-specific DNA-methyltransferase
MPRKPKTAPASPKATPLEKTEVEVTDAKGRPMLTWVGKRPLRHVTAFPAQHVEVFNPTGEIAERAGMLFHGDNKEVLAYLLAKGFRGKIDLIYIDPPFDSGADYVRRVELRGTKGTARLEGQGYTLGEQVQYTDIWANDNYLQFMYERLLLLKELLADGGTIYLHCDWHKGHYLRCVMDEVFGAEHLQNEIVWQRTDAHNDPKRAGNIHDVLLLYCKGDEWCWNVLYTPLPESTVDAWYSNEEVVDKDIVNKLGVRLPKGTKRRFNKADITGAGANRNDRPWHDTMPPSGRHWAYKREVLDKLLEDGRIWFSESGRPYEKRYLDESRGRPIQSVWVDIPMIRGIHVNGEGVDYPTQKPEALLERILLASSNPGAVVLDCFVGSGTTLSVAQKLGRRWIGCDINKGAIQTSSKRLQTIITEQTGADNGRTKQGSLIQAGGEKTPKPAQLSFSVYRVNDYDVQIQHNEAVTLACEHIGVTRTKTDAFFDGIRGKRLAKIIPFGHPLTVLDLEEVKRELTARPSEERDVVVVCLGKELAVDAWLEEWNRLRKKGDVPNKIEVIELRTDPKYGKFIAHQPAQARVRFERKKDRLIVGVEDFISPTVVERLSQQEGVLKPKITDWRAMVDCVAIDPAYDGKVFNVVLSDVPEKKSELVKGKYELQVLSGKTTVAVKITDMLGEEVLVTKLI